MTIYQAVLTRTQIALASTIDASLVKASEEDLNSTLRFNLLTGEIPDFSDFFFKYGKPKIPWGKAFFNVEYKVSHGIYQVQ
jgi:hypothetical protein